MEKKRFAVFGNPIIHSFSPQIYHQLFKKNNVDGKYNRILANKPEDIIKYIKEFELLGCNITSPLKSSIIPFLSNIANDAKKINAVNTIKNCDDKLLGFNTDWKGVLNSLKNYYSKKNIEFNLNNKKILIIGAGNSASAAIYGIKTFYPNSNIDIINRTIDTAKKLAKIYNSNFISDKINSISFNKYDIIINTIPNPSEYLPCIEFPKKTILFFSDYTDLDYFDNLKEKNNNVIIGNEWLKEQAIAAFKHFYGYEKYLKKVILTTQQIQKKFNNLKNQTIFLTGFSGAGKSYIGEKIAEYLDKPFYDLDRMIEEDCNENIKNIFKNKGENIFRNYEKKMLFKLKNKEGVVALGGGTLMDSDNLKYIKKGFVIYLYSDLATTLSRINISSRPILVDKTESEIEKIFNIRKYIYFDNSDIIIENTNKSIDNIINEVSVFRNL